MGYANPDAVTQIANGLSTTTFTYDNNGNVTQKTTDGTTTTYVYDYANRLTALGAGGATTTYAYDAFGQRVLQTGTTTTYLYPLKWYSVASSTGSGAKFATTTDYLFNGDSMVATVDQQTATGSATGTAKTRYIHPDHLGSTNVVTDENDNLVQTLDYYPYGATRISSATSTNERRKYIGQFADDSSLNYLNARYYEAGRGQFISQDPMFWSKDQNLRDPQSLNSYSYASDNPITNKDPDGLLTQAQSDSLAAIAVQLQSILSTLNSISASGGSLSSSQAGSISQTLSAAQRTVSYIANGGGATVVNGVMTWSPQTSQKTVTPYTPNLTNGVLGVAGGNTPQGAAAGIGAIVVGAGAVAACGEFCTVGGIISTGLGSTGRTQAVNLAEQLAMQEIKANPGMGKAIIENLGDPRWAGGTKMQYVKDTSVGKIVIH
jgi:RHS repeat-associated protein